MSTFKVGDMVEIVMDHAWQGRCAVVTGIGGHYQKPYGVIHTDGVFTTPTPWKTACWAPTQLRKINPPDWTAPLATDREVSA